MEILRGMEVKITGVIHRLIFKKKKKKNFLIFFFLGGGGGGGGHICANYWGGGGTSPPCPSYSYGPNVMLTLNRRNHCTVFSVKL